MKIKEGKEKFFDLYAANDWIRDLDINSGEKAILYSLASRMNREGFCYPGLQRLAKDAGYRSSKSVSLVLSRLKEKSLIQVTPRNKGHGIKKTNLYSFPQLEFLTKIFVTSAQLEDAELEIWLANICSCFNHKNMTFNIFAKFLYTLREQFYPEFPTHKFSKYDASAIKELRNFCNPEYTAGKPPLEISYEILHTLGVSYAEWERVRDLVKKHNYHASLSKLPTPVSILHNFSDIDFIVLEHWPPVYIKT